MHDRRTDPLDSLHDMTEALAEILYKISEEVEPEEEVSKFLKSVEDLKDYFEGIGGEECPPGQDLGIDTLPIDMHLQDKE